jgi:very-short-patch-repair endonuclease
MEYLFLLIPLAILAAVYFLRGDGVFTPPEVSPIADETLRAFEAAPSLWVNTAEAAMFATLCRHMPPGFHVHGKVRLEDIIRVRRSLPEKARWAARGRVKSRHVDYLITNRAGHIVLAVELDGHVHNARNPSEADKVKTALFKAAGVPLRRIRVGEDFDGIAATIGSELKAS